MTNGLAMLRTAILVGATAAVLAVPAKAGTPCDMLVYAMIWDTKGALQLFHAPDYPGRAREMVEEDYSRWARGLYSTNAEDWDRCAHQTNLPAQLLFPDGDDQPNDEGQGREALIRNTYCHLLGFHLATFATWLNSPSDDTEEAKNNQALELERFKTSHPGWESYACGRRWKNATPRQPR